MNWPYAGGGRRSFDDEERSDVVDADASDDDRKSDRSKLTQLIEFVGRL